MNSENAWPGIVVVDGPPLPGEQGRVFAVETGVALTPTGVVPFFQPLPSWRPSPPEVWGQEETLVRTEGLWRHRQHRGAPLVDRHDGEQLRVGDWTLELRGDVGATIELKRWKSRVLCRPLGRVGAWAALWLLATEPQWWITLDAVGFRRRLRRVGVPLEGLGQRVDPAVARVIARGAADLSRDVGVTFDGVVDGETWGNQRGLAGAHFATLTAELPHAPFEGPLAPVDVVADFVRSMDPVGWAREALLREECAIAVSMLKPERT